MSIHTIKKVAELVPEVAGMIKAANLQTDLSTESKEDTILSALSMAYMTKVAHTPVSEEDGMRVAKAVDLYQVQGIVQDHALSMIKAARDKQLGRSISDEVLNAEGLIESQIGFSPDFEKVAEASEALFDAHTSSISSDTVKLYAGAHTIDKQAAVAACLWRAKRTGNNEFTKIARVLNSTNIDTLTVEDNRAIVSAIRGLEKSANYIESNIYKDIFTKEASVNVNLMKKSVSAESIIKVASHIGDVLGADLGQAIGSADTMSVKHIVEALPNGEKEVIEGIV